MKHILAIAILLMPVAAHASASGCAIVGKTSDGFLNLRQAPTMKALTIAKLRPGWHLSIDTDTCETSGSVSVCGGAGWTHVTGVWPLDGGADSATPTHGWVATRYLQFVECQD